MIRRKIKAGQRHPHDEVRHKKPVAKEISRLDGKNEFETMNREDYRREELAFHRAQQVGDFWWMGVDPRRKVELAHGGMVREDHKAMANLPTQAIHTEYPDRGFSSNGFGSNELYDGIVLASASEEE